MPSCPDFAARKVGESEKGFTTVALGLAFLRFRTSELRRALILHLLFHNQDSFEVFAHIKNMANLGGELVVFQRVLFPHNLLNESLKEKRRFCNCIQYVSRLRQGESTDLVHL
jgi:hypothetical protein